MILTPQNHKKKLYLFIRGWCFSAMIALLIATSIKSAIADWYVVPTGSMKPTIVEGDRIFTNKLAYDLKIPYTTFHITRWDDPKRGDIVVFISPIDGKRLVKRVIGLPGDEIALQNNRLYVNGISMSYESLSPDHFPEMTTENFPEPLFFNELLAGKSHPVMITPSVPSLRSFSGVGIPDGHYFMMGDNRDNSADSRYFGFVARRSILGKANGVVISLDLDHHYRPRWKRFFTKLY